MYIPAPLDQLTIFSLHNATFQAFGKTQQRAIYLQPSRLYSSSPSFPCELVGTGGKTL